MDAAGARALARRIEEQRALDEERRFLRAPTKASFAPAPAATTLPAPSPLGESVTLVRPAARASEGRRDIRRYTKDVRREDVGGGPTVITTIRCHSLVGGRWQSRVVDVRVESV